MNFWDRITGNDMSREMKAFSQRAQLLPTAYQEAWEKVCLYLMPHGDFTGRKLMPILDGVLGLLEEAAAEGHDIQEVLGDDIQGFCSALGGETGAKTYRDKWRTQLNNDIAKKLGK